MEDWSDEAERATLFFVRIGLPAKLEQLGSAADDSDCLATVVEAAAGFPFMSNMPMEVSAGMLHKAILDADRLGQTISEELGDTAYRALQG